MFTARQIIFAAWPYQIANTIGQAAKNYLPGSKKLSARRQTLSVRRQTLSARRQHYLSGGKHYLPGCKHYLPGCKHYLPGCKHYLPGCKHYLPGCKHYLPGCKHYLPGCKHYLPSWESNKLQHVISWDIFYCLVFKKNNFNLIKNVYCTVNGEGQVKTEWHRHTIC